MQPRNRLLTTHAQSPFVVLNISYAYLGGIIIFGGLVGVVCVKRVFLHLLGTTCVQQPRMRVAATN